MTTPNTVMYEAGKGVKILPGGNVGVVGNAWKKLHLARVDEALLTGGMNPKHSDNKYKCALLNKLSTKWGWGPYGGTGDRSICVGDASLVDWEERYWSNRHGKRQFHQGVHCHKLKMGNTIDGQETENGAKRHGTDDGGLKVFDCSHNVNTSLILSYKIV